MKICVNCGEDENYVDFQENCSSELCQWCYYEIFRNIIPGIQPPKARVYKTEEYIPEVLLETKQWKKKRKDIRYSLLDGKWAREFIHILDQK